MNVNGVEIEFKKDDALDRYATGYREYRPVTSKLDELIDENLKSLSEETKAEILRMKQAGTKYEKIAKHFRKKGITITKKIIEDVMRETKKKEMSVLSEEELKWW